MSVTIYPRVNGDTCVLCRRKFARGDRVQIVNIIENVGTHPNNPREVGAWFSGEFELKHVNCADTGLDGAILLSHK